LFFFCICYIFVSVFYYNYYWVSLHLSDIAPIAGMRVL